MNITKIKNQNLFDYRTERTQSVEFRAKRVWKTSIIDAIRLFNQSIGT